MPFAELRNASLATFYPSEREHSNCQTSGKSHYDLSEGKDVRMDMCFYSGAEDTEGLAAALLASMTESEGANSRPPAAKYAVRSLLKESLTAERLQELGDDVQCSVCR